MAKKMQIGDMLVAAGYINKIQLEECLKAGKDTDKRVGDIAVERGYITQENLYRLLENQHNVQYVDLYTIQVPPEVSKLVSIEVARRNVLVPVKIENNILYVAMEDPKNFRALQQVRTVAHMDVRPMLASKRSIESCIERVYGNVYVQAAVTEFGGKGMESVMKEVIDSKSGNVGDGPIIQLVNVLLEQAVTSGASDIHIEPGELEVRVRMRIDGVLSVVLNAPIATHSAMIARIKIMSDLNIAERRVPQDGRIQIKILGRDVDLRVSIVSTVHGEKAVLRLLDRSSFFKPKDVLGFTPQNLEKFDSLLTTPHGIILVAGPTGSGKSTTLYTMLADINDVRDNLITIEDPVEYVLEGLTQMQVNPKAGVDFATGLRAILRQDPDVILVGEIRDKETVEIAVRAAITGHLVLSSIHTNDAVSTILRLVDMGVPDYMVATSVVGIISQRLVRVICPQCKVDYEPTQNELESAHISNEEAKEINFKRGAGCMGCDLKGYKGRRAVHEILVFDNKFRNMIHDKKSVDEMRNYAETHGGMQSLRNAAMTLLKNGITTIEEMVDIVHGL
ncbi:MAG: Flp pilus assembly complex ATPase component TadA [Defluviitaleaceae bacterium]|nr:Flp pilus assembly complex ATPase component TadA [Defluviitaleaceae bacterium]MCL2262145.1 Flp pilus assembly complex ATPase component TadA [Defluviitaleaceae bacterium]